MRSCSVLGVQYDVYAGDANSKKQPHLGGVQDALVGRKSEQFLDDGTYDKHSV